MKKLLLSYLLVFVFGFMFFFYEPIIMYATNIYDFTYDLYIILGPIFVSFIIFLIIGCFFYTLIYYINKKFFPKKKIYEMFIFILLFFLIGFFIQGNFLSNNLPRLDGTDIIWNDYVKENIISIISWSFVFFILTFSLKKYGVLKIIKKIPVLLIFMFIIFAFTFTTFMVFTEGVFDIKNPAVSLTKNYSLVSADKNFFILLLDSVDSVMFEEVMQKKGYESVFNDFTYYKDTMSTYVYTRDSVPFILTGKWNYNKNNFNDYSTEAFDNSSLIKLLENNNYNINIYSNDITWDSDKISSVSNLMRFDRKLNYRNYLKEQKRFILFKYLPFPLKFLSNIEELNFDRGKLNYDLDLFNNNDIVAYNFYRNGNLVETNNKVFKFIHLEGAHVPFDLDNKVSYVGVGKGTYYDKVESSIHIIDAFLKQLKETGVYDNSAIIIMSDHGYALGNGSFDRQNPIFLVKGVDEHHELISSDLAISYTDLEKLYSELINNEKGNDLFSDVDPDKKRKVIVYCYGRENHMVEYVQNGKAWEEKKLVPTGKEYQR